MMSRLSYVAIAITMSVLTLAGCGADPAPLSDHSLTELCERPEQLLTDVWHFAEPVVGKPLVPDTDDPDTVGAGGHCRFTVDGGRVAALSLIREVRGMGEPPDDADSIYVGDHTVKTWAIGTARLAFETVNGGWEASMTVTPGADLATGEPAATDAQLEETARELVDTLAEFKGPDRTPTEY